MPPSDDRRDSPALRQEGPQQDLWAVIERAYELVVSAQVRETKRAQKRDIAELRELLEAALSASRTAQAPQQDAWALMDRIYKKVCAMTPGLPQPTTAFYDFGVPMLAELLAALQARIQVLETSVDYLRYLVDHPVKQWLPIATAPTGEVLLYRPQMPPLERITVRRANDWCGEKCCPSARPTHWIPIPDPPVAPAEGE